MDGKVKQVQRPMSIQNRFYNVQLGVFIAEKRLKDVIVEPIAQRSIRTESKLSVTRQHTEGTPPKTHLCIISAPCASACCCLTFSQSNLKQYPGNLLRIVRLNRSSSSIILALQASHSCRATLSSGEGRGWSTLAEEIVREMHDAMVLDLPCHPETRTSSHSSILVFLRGADTPNPRVYTYSKGSSPSVYRPPIRLGTFGRAQRGGRQLDDLTVVRPHALEELLGGH